MVRRDAILQGLQQHKEHYDFLQQQYNKVKDEITVLSPFRDSVEETLRTYLQNLVAEENWARTYQEAGEMATVAEKFDNLVIRKLYNLFPLAMFIRMLDSQIKAASKTSTLTSVLVETRTAFETLCSELETSLDYTVIPIQKLVRVQLGSALLSADHASKRKNKAA